MARHDQAEIGEALVPGGGRDLGQLKAEVQARVDNKRPPLAGIRSEDARAVLAQITSLSREEWATAWSSAAERYFTQAQSLEANGSAAAAEHYWHAWRLHHFARWPVENTPARRRAKQRALDYLVTRADVDAGRIVIQGRSWSGYWAAKLAVTERARLCGAVVHGGPIHGYFQPQWLRPSLETGEYLYDYFQAKAQLVGVTTVEDLLDRNRRFSLLDAGLLDQPSAPMLVVNGARDSQVPVADVFVLLAHGDAKEAWVNPVGGHMGRSPQWPSQAIFERVVMPWIARRLELTS